MLLIHLTPLFPVSCGSLKLPNLCTNVVTLSTHWTKVLWFHAMRTLFYVIDILILLTFNLSSRTTSYFEKLIWFLTFLNAKEDGTVNDEITVWRLLWQHFRRLKILPLRWSFMFRCLLFVHSNSNEVYGKNMSTY